jgi:bifunctional N-acetylglucosamine-1-phosphate-uridyltransferase/glucosamine-1-phosphate-acetyltransferase GlmU-like protein
MTAWLNAYVAHVIEAAGRDARMADKLMRVMHLLAPPSTLFSVAQKRPARPSSA